MKYVRKCTVFWRGASIQFPCSKRSIQGSKTFPIINQIIRGDHDIWTAPRVLPSPDSESRSDPPAIAGSLPATTRLQVQARVVGSARPLGGGTVRDESELANHGRGLVGSCRPVFGRPAAATRKKREAKLVALPPAHRSYAARAQGVSCTVGVATCGEQIEDD